MDYSYLIPGDKIKKLDPIQLLDLRDYCQMRNKCLPCVVKFREMRSMVVTERGTTLWQLVEIYLEDLEFRPIGQIEAPTELFEWVLKNSK